MYSQKFPFADFEESVVDKFLKTQNTDRFAKSIQHATPRKRNYSETCLPNKLFSHNGKETRLSNADERSSSSSSSSNNNNNNKRRPCAEQCSKNNSQHLKFNIKQSKEVVFEGLLCKDETSHIVPEHTVALQDSRLLLVTDTDLHSRASCILTKIIATFVEIVHDSSTVHVSFKVRRRLPDGVTQWVLIRPSNCSQGNNLSFLLNHIEFHDNAVVYSQLMNVSVQRLRDLAKLYHTIFVYDNVEHKSLTGTKHILTEQVIREIWKFVELIDSCLMFHKTALSTRECNKLSRVDTDKLCVCRDDAIEMLESVFFTLQHLHCSKQNVLAIQHNKSVSNCSNTAVATEIMRRLQRQMRWTPQLAQFVVQMAANPFVYDQLF